VKVFSSLRTYKKLGLRNCAAVASYRFLLRAGFYERQLPLRPCPIPEPLNCEPELASIASDGCLATADALLAGKAAWFGDQVFSVATPPDWFFDPFSAQHFPDQSQHWSRCRPFQYADIKRCWELSRWSWAPLLIRAWRLTGDHSYRDAFNSWCHSWCQSNPVNGGSNWLCGQEASIRLLHALQAWQLADSPLAFPDASPQRAAFAAAHLQRIFATAYYARAQDNNHWTSEAAALFIGGSWLAASASVYAIDGQHWAKEGRLALEHSVARLVMADGSFAQHSLTYHRLLLDTLAQVELWRRWLDLPHFSERFQQRCRAATHWFGALLDPCSGDGPNLGSNDGAFIYQLHNRPFRDFRPTYQLASVLFFGKTPLSPGPWDESLHWLGLINSPTDIFAAPLVKALDVSSLGSPQVVELFAKGGYAVLRPATTNWALLRLPTYRFRPAHADPLHLDLWCQGVNLLRDGGSYAYNADPVELAYFPGIASHNTFQFDNVEPMPRIGRFLFGDWLQLEGPARLEPHSVTAAYSCPHGRHQRQVQVDVTGYRWIITDICSGFQHNAILRWRLCPGDWCLEGFSLISPLATLQIHCDQPITRLELVSGWESRHYGAKTPLQVLEVCVEQAPATFITSIQISA